MEECQVADVPDGTGIFIVDCHSHIHQTLDAHRDEVLYRKFLLDKNSAYVCISCGENVH